MDAQQVAATKKKRKHVRVACTNCRKSKTGCDPGRPCKRCIAQGWQDSCVDRPPSVSTIKKDGELKEEFSCTESLFGPFNDSFSTIVLSPNMFPHLANQGPTEDTNSNPQENHQDGNQQSCFRLDCSPRTPSVRGEDCETQCLQNTIRMLERTGAEQEQKIRELQNNLRTQAFFSSFALSRWKLSYPACHLLSFSVGFCEMLHHPPEVLTKGFTCAHLYPPGAHCHSAEFHRFIECGTAESFTMRMPLQRGNGDVLDVLAILKIEYENDVPVGISACMTEFLPHNSLFADAPYFKPLHIKTRNPPESVISQNITNT